MNIDWPTK